MIRLLQDLTSYELLTDTLNIMDRSLANKDHPQTTFLVGVAYICANSKLSRGRAEKALAYSLIDLLENDDNPFLEVIGLVLLPWYVKMWWRIGAKLKKADK